MNLIESERSARTRWREHSRLSTPSRPIQLSRNGSARLLPKLDTRKWTGHFMADVRAQKTRRLRCAANRPARTGGGQTTSETCRPARPTSGVSSAALFGAARRDGHPPSSGAHPPGRTNKACGWSGSGQAQIVIRSLGHCGAGASN
jgi:hypothetical protein